MGLQVSWLTPVEIFQPHYGAAIAHYLAAQHRAQQAQRAQRQGQAGAPPQPLRVYEIGGGTGTLARNILVRCVGRRAGAPEILGSRDPGI